MGLLLRWIDAVSFAVHDCIAAFRFWRSTGVRRSTVRRVFRALSNLYLTPDRAGSVGLSDERAIVTIVTSTPRMSVAVSREDGPSCVYWVNRDALTASIGAGEELPLEDESNRFILDLVVCFASQGVPIQPNSEGVKYYPMPGEEERVGAS